MGNVLDVLAAIWPMILERLFWTSKQFLITGGKPELNTWRRPQFNEFDLFWKISVQVIFSLRDHSLCDQWVPWIKFLNLSVFTSKVKLWCFPILITQMQALKTWSYKYMTLRRIWYKSCSGKIHNFSVPSVTAIKIWCSSFWLTNN